MLYALSSVFYYISSWVYFSVNFCFFISKNTCAENYFVYPALGQFIRSGGNVDAVCIIAKN